MLKRSRVLGPLLVVLLLLVGSGVTGPARPASAAVAGPAATSTTGSAPGFRCVMDAFGHTTSGRIMFRRVVNARVTVSRSTRERLDWRPISWALMSSASEPGHETTRQVVAATDGKVRVVETAWDGRDRLDVRVIKVIGHGYPSRLVTFDTRRLYWVAPDGSLQRATWTGRELANRTTVPVSIDGATAMTSFLTDRGPRIYYTDGSGDLHVVADEGPRSTDTVLGSAGHDVTTGLRAGTCTSPDLTEVRPYVGLLSVDRRTGVGHFQRALRPESLDDSDVTTPVRVTPSDWTWRRLG
ncbi:hypothetical protein [Nocardioides dongxiaopingii]|uniref:hypothetical protein n=1 Tax=Nocardioides sp. S-1144 TaxID=2582905 RepID=UPI0016521BC1|nr:hypothetical protein [Nocardioides sp. S-1144]